MDREGDSNALWVANGVSSREAPKGAYPSDFRPFCGGIGVFRVALTGFRHAWASPPRVDHG